MKTKTFIELKNVSKSFRLDSGAEIPAISEVSLSVQGDEIVALLGPSGSGKSTCLRIMAGILDPSKGEVLVEGQPLEGVNYDVSFVFQSSALFPWETIYSNVELALLPLGLAPTENRERVKRVIDLVGLEGFEEAYPRELSGGMKQRVGIARALVMERPIIFLDEPFSSLDILTADHLRSEITNIITKKQTKTSSMVIVSHNIQEAVQMASRILVMGSNPGHVRAEILNPLPYPRDEESWQFKRLVAQIHGLITETLMPDQPAGSERRPQKDQKSRMMQVPPNVQILEVIALLEEIYSDGGQADIFELAQQIRKDFGYTLYLVKAAEIMDLVETPRQLVVLTDLGEKFVQGDINLRKRVLHEVFGSLKVVDMVAQKLRERENIRISVDDLTEALAEWLPNENPTNILSVLISWGRYAEFFGYNDDTKELYLDVGQETAL